MKPMHQAWQTSSHKNVDCYSCHAEQGLEGTIKTKAKGLKELYLHTTGQVPPVIKAEERNVNCFSCHQDKVKGNAERAFAAKDPHTVKHFDNGMTCVSCHGGLVHNPKANNMVPSRDACTTCHLDQMKK
jgi:trimethylamine-N-oxide reductase cytochrome c-type subunit TorC